MAPPQPATSPAIQMTVLVPENCTQKYPVTLIPFAGRKNGSFAIMLLIFSFLRKILPVSKHHKVVLLSGGQLSRFAEEMITRFGQYIRTNY
jgi:hypothetical protein